MGTQLREVSLDDKYKAREGQVYLNGTQALVRLSLLQKEADEASGLNTEGFVSGYRGSPVGTVDLEFSRARKFAEAAKIRFQMGVNEDLAATAVWGTQQINLLEKARVDGVFSMWYGKGPGVDRSGDVLRHGNLAGSAAHGGVLLLAGDDHTCKSSTTAHQSEFAFVDAMIPVLNPAGVEDIVRLGRVGWALSRYSGCWSAMKLIAETMDSSAVIDGTVGLDSFVLPEDPDAGSLSIRWPDTPQEMERRLHEDKLPAVRAFALANNLDRVMVPTRKRRIGIMTTGKAYLDVRSTLELLGLSLEDAAALGIEVFKVAMPWPLVPETAHNFMKGLTDLIVIEEKRPLIESQIKEMLFSVPADKRPRVHGKAHAGGQPLLPTHGDMNPQQIAGAFAAIFADAADLSELANQARALSDSQDNPTPTDVARTPYFCSGCPHNTSTKVPEGSRAMAGIGCSYMAQWMDRRTELYTHMGAEGANWIGQAPYVPTKHVFQNIGDGTYFHSGLMAIRAACAAQANITYKILYNDAVAMTGGQKHDGQLTPQIIAEQVRAEGAMRVVVVSDDIEKYKTQDAFPRDVSVHDRADLDQVQKDLAEVSGVTVLIYDQTCAAEKRRRRKRGTMPDPDRRIVINEAVCEGCGDCSAKSNCLSVTPVETAFGTKRRIDQSSCNKDFSCVNGFCPSFVSVSGAQIKRDVGVDVDSALMADAPAPQLPSLDTPHRVLITGVGGTGVVTVAAILAMAANIEGKASTTLDMAGLAQKGGQVTSHLTFANKPKDIAAVRIPDAQADLLLGCDLVVAGGKEALGVIGKGKTKAILNSAEIITADFIKDRNFRIPGSGIATLVANRAGQSVTQVVDAGKIAQKLLGDAIGANMFLVGVAYQSGTLPLTSDAIERAIELNGVSIPQNLTAFRLGRRYVLEPEWVQGQIDGDSQTIVPQTLEELVAHRKEHLTAYQNMKWAERYAHRIARIKALEKRVSGKAGPVTEAAARNLAKLMSYKDEYEVARLFSDGRFNAQLGRSFGSWDGLRFHLAPPILSKRHPSTGELQKMTFGQWLTRAFPVLAKGKALRGTVFDPFGKTAERRMERRLIADYEADLDLVEQHLSADTLVWAVELLSLPDQVRGFGHVKEAAVEVYDSRRAVLRKTPVPTRMAAE